MRVLDPRGATAQPPVSLNPLPASLRGLRLGYLDNTKWNYQLLNDHLDRLLEQAYGTVRQQYEHKRGPSWPATEAELARFRGDIDLYLTGMGD